MNTPLSKAVNRPIHPSDRITNLDTIRGVAVLGILGMNAVSYGLPMAAYFNLAAHGSETWLDWAIAVISEIFIDQKMMGLFSILFGAGIALFADRATLKTGHGVQLSLWRNVLLLIIGVFHSMLWDGDVLMIYAFCAPLVLLLRHLHPTFLILIGTTVVLGVAVHAALVQNTASLDPTLLGSYWWVGELTMSDAVGLFLLNNFVGRAFGMMLIGVALYKLGVVNGNRPADFYHRILWIGLSLGLPLATLGVILQAINQYSPHIALIGEIPNILATIPMTLAYLALISLWNQRSTSMIHSRIQAVGRMALTNYLTQTLLGIIILRGFYDADSLTRSGILIFVIMATVLQLMWSKPWFDHFRFGPVEWLWRCVTYRRQQPLKIINNPHKRIMT